MKATHVRVLAHDEEIDLVDKSETSGSAPPPVQPLPVGTRLHDYEIRSVLGRSEAGLVCEQPIQCRRGLPQAIVRNGFELAGRGTCQPLSEPVE